jgi:hypothetical protein
MNMPANPLPFRDIMQRTMANLKFIEERQRPDGPYEVTQLVNSFLGVLVHPWEKHEALLNEALDKNGCRCGFPTIQNKIGNVQTPLKDIFNKLRDGMAHGNVKYNGSNGEVESLTIWNIPIYINRVKNTDTRNWEAEMS